MNQPLWISHRGLRENAIENTIQSFDSAIENGFRILETDLRVSKDEHLVLCHDSDLQRIGGPSEKIEDLTREEISFLRLPYSQKILFFDEFMDRYAAYSWVFDIKPDVGIKTINSLMAWAKANHAFSLLKEQAYFLFWDQEQEDRFLSLLPQAKIFARELECWRAGFSVMLGLTFMSGIQKDRWYALPPRFAGVSLFRKSIVERYHRFGCGVIAYLPENEQQAIRAIEAGVDMILTDHRRVDL